MHAIADRKLHPDHVRLAIGVLDLRLGQRRLLHRRPHHRLRPALELSAHRHFQELVHRRRFRRIGHRQIGIVPVPCPAQPLELAALDVDPLLRIVAARLAELYRRHIALLFAGRAELLLHLPLDRKTVAVPAGNIVRVIAHHLPRADDEVLQDLVHRRADMDVPVRIGRAIVQHEGRRLARLRVRAQLSIDVGSFPLLQPLGLLAGQAPAHRKIGLRQEQRVLVGIRCVVFFSFGHWIGRRFEMMGAFRRIRLSRR